MSKQQPRFTERGFFVIRRDSEVISEDSVYVDEVDETRISEALSPVIPR